MEQLNHFAIAGADNKFVWAKTCIIKDKVIAWIEKITEPKAIRYAWAESPATRNIVYAANDKRVQFWIFYISLII